MKNENYGEIVIFQSDDGLVKIDVSMHDDTVWLNLEQMSQLFDRDKSTISRHIKNVFDVGELQHDSTVANFATVQNEGIRKVERNIDLDISRSFIEDVNKEKAFRSFVVILSVGLILEKHQRIKVILLFLELHLY